MARILAAELLAHRTWPCIAEAPLGSWILRAADGFSRRANSALAIGSPGTDLDQALKHLSAWSRKQGIQPCIKITPLADPSLDDALQVRGWTIATPSLVLQADPQGAPPPEPSSLALHLDSHPSDEWFSSLVRWEGVSAAKAQLHHALLSRMPSPWFASWRKSGSLDAVAALVRDGDVLHLYDLAVAPDRRGCGIGTRFLKALISRMRGEGVENAVLQVLESNTPARALYSSTGFVASHHYHYRVAP